MYDKDMQEPHSSHFDLDRWSHSKSLLLFVKYDHANDVKLSVIYSSLIQM